MLRKHKIEKNIKHIINQMLYTFDLYSMYNVIIEFDNIKHQIIFYEKDNKMLNTLNKLIDNYNKYYLKNNKFNIISIKKNSKCQLKLNFPFTIDDHFKKVVKLNEIKYLIHNY